MPHRYAAKQIRTFKPEFREFTVFSGTESGLAFTLFSAFALPPTIAPIRFLPDTSHTFLGYFPIPSGHVRKERGKEKKLT